MPLQCISSFTRSVGSSTSTPHPHGLCSTGGILVFDKLNGNDGHRLENVMTMEIGLNRLFGGLGLWFEATVGYRFVASYLTHGHNVRTCPTNIHYVYAIVSFLPSRSSLRSSHQLRKLLVERSLYLPAQLIGPSEFPCAQHANGRAGLEVAWR